MSEKAQKLITLLVGVLAMSLTIGYIVFAWVEPSQPPPGGNVPAPINVGSESQSKAGSLTVATEAGTSLRIGSGAFQLAKDGLSLAFKNNAGVTRMIIGDDGNVGIGTPSPRTRLELGNDGAILAIGTFNSGWTEQSLGAGTRLLWYPRKAAFRAGRVTGTQWNDANIGYYSTAMGYDTIAFGSYSTAMGYNTLAGGSYSTAMGRNTRAIGHYSTAMGYGIEVQGNYSVAIALNDQTGTVVSQSNTMSIMGGNVGIGTTSPRTRLELGNDGAILAIGTFNSGWTEQSLGAGTRLLWYPRKAAFRAGRVTGTQWNDANIGYSSTAMGYDTLASGYYSTAMGRNTTASGYSSTAMGYNTTASGHYSTAMGRGIRASGNYSVAIALNDQTGTVVSQSNTMSIMGGNVGIGATSIPSGVKLYSYRPDGDYGAGKASIYGYRYGSSAASNGGTGWNPNEVDAAVKGYSHYGNQYTAGVAGYVWNASPRSAAVIGRSYHTDIWEGYAWGALGYLDPDSNFWGVYTPGFAYVGYRLGLGTLPGNILTVVMNSPTDPIADAWTTYSTPDSKIILQRAEDLSSDYLEKFKKLPVYLWKRTEGEPKRLGVVATEDVPEEILAFDDEGNIQGIDLEGYIGFLHEVMKAQQKEIEELKLQLDSLTNK